MAFAGTYYPKGYPLSEMKPVVGTYMDYAYIPLGHGTAGFRVTYVSQEERSHGKKSKTKRVHK